MSHAQLTRQQWHAMRRELHDLNEWLATHARRCQPDYDERWDGKARRRHQLRMSMPVPRDPNGFGVMQQNWNRRRSHVLARVRDRKRAAMVRAHGEGLLAFVDRKCGFVRDAECRALRAQP